MKKYIRILQMGLQNHLEYRGNCFLALLVSFIPFGVNILIWLAAISTSENPTFTTEGIITYYFLILIVSNLTECNIQYSISDDIRLGKLNKFLLQPYNYMVYYLMIDLPKRVVFILVGAVPIGVIYLFLHKYISIEFNMVIMLLFLVSLAVGYLLNFTLNFLISECSFYFSQVTSLFTSFNVAKGIAAGDIFPLNAFPKNILAVFAILPFQYLGYFPVSILTENISINDIIFKIFIGIVWIFVLFGLGCILWVKGLKRYAAFSG